MNEDEATELFEQIRVRALAMANLALVGEGIRTLTRAEDGVLETGIGAAIGATVEVLSELGIIENVAGP